MARIERRVTPYGDIEYGVTVAEDGTTRVERFECKDSKSISFNETRYPDGRTTIERVEHPTGDKDFDIVFLPDGSRIVGRIEHANGKKHLNLVTEAEGRTTEAGPTQ
jgi:hypothetical protein